MTPDPATPLTRSQWLARGIPARSLSSAAYRRLGRGIYVPAVTSVDALVEARAALHLGGRRAFVSHHLAVRLYGAHPPDTDRLHISVPHGSARSIAPEAMVHVSAREPVRFRGLPVTSPADSFLDMASQVNLVELVIVGDGLVRARRVTPDALVHAAAAASGRFMRLARRAAALVREGVDSPMETRSRMLRALAGLPELETDIRFHDGQGNLLRRLDAGDRTTRTAAEYDGRHHIEREQQWEADIGRREEFEDADWRLITITAKDIHRSPDLTVLRMERLFRGRGMFFGSLTDEWRRYFPVRIPPAGR